MKQLAWHFVGDQLRNGDPVPADGIWLEWNKPLVMCSQGLHASLQPFDALQHAPGHTLCQVEISGTVIYEKDKLVCSKRKIVQRKDFEEQLFQFARQQALKVVHLWKAPKIVIDYLHSGDKQLKSATKSAAESAARSAAESAARSAAWSAAWSAARSAAESAAWSAARSAAWSAAESAAESAARSAAWSAAESAAESAARSAAESAARLEFNQMVYKEFQI